MKLNGMPNEDYKIQQGYEPNAVQVRPVLYDAWRAHRLKLQYLKLTL
jgi:hypothetical protein